MSSSFTYTLRKRRIWPVSSRRCGFSWGNLSPRTENSSPRLAAEQSRLAMPSVWRRRAVGICTVIDMSGHRRLGNLQTALEEALKLDELRSDGGLRLVCARQRVSRLEAIAGNAEN